MTFIIEEDRSICPYCHYGVYSHWSVEIDDYGNKIQHGMISEPQVTLVATWVYHSECWDKLVEEHPP
jgi:hypothetical protein